MPTGFSPSYTASSALDDLYKKTNTAVMQAIKTRTEENDWFDDVPDEDIILSANEMRLVLDVNFETGAAMIPEGGYEATLTSVAPEHGTFTPVQVASIVALEGPQACVDEIRMKYQKRRDVLVKGLHEAGWMVDLPKATMYIWARIPEAYQAMGSLEFAKKLLEEAKVAVSPGIGFGEYGDTHVRLAMIENEARTRQAVRGIKEMLRKDGLLARPVAAIAS